MKNRLKMLRAELGWSQAVLAEKLEVSRQTVFHPYLRVAQNFPNSQRTTIIRLM